MRPVQFTCIMILSVAATTSIAPAALAEDYTYAPPPSPAATEALQTPTKTPNAYADLKKQSNLSAVDTTPGLIRPATRIAEWTSHDDDHRGFACADKKCKMVTPVYNTRTPLEQEQNRYGSE